MMLQGWSLTAEKLFVLLNLPSTVCGPSYPYTQGSTMPVLAYITAELIALQAQGSAQNRAKSSMQLHPS